MHRSLVRRLATTAVVAYAVLAAGAVGAHSNPPGCSETGVSLSLRELRDSDNDGIGDQPITGSKEQGETIYYEARLRHLGLPQCAYEGGALCIDPPDAPTACSDVTPLGGVPLLCDDPSCSPAGVAFVLSQQLPYVVDLGDAEPSGLCTGLVRAVASYRGGVSHFGPTNVAPVEADAPICNEVVTPTPTPTATPTASPTPTPTPTPTVTPTPVPVNHFQCYEIHRPPLALSVTLDDAFGPSTVDVKRAKRFCNPADKNGEDPTAPTDPDHLTIYTIKQRTPRFQKVRDLHVLNQFGELVLDLGRPAAMLVPTAKSHSTTPPLLANPIDHFKCYQAQRARFRASDLMVRDQFTTQQLDIRKPLRLCAPAGANGSAVADPDTYLVCYAVRASRGAVRFRGSAPFFTANAFESAELPVFRPLELCIPSVRVP